jgi:hypothetical protein
MLLAAAGAAETFGGPVTSERRRPRCAAPARDAGGGPTIPAHLAAPAMDTQAARRPAADADALLDEAFGPETT